MTDIELVKLLIGSVATALFSDAEIQAFLTLGGSVYVAAALALKGAVGDLASGLKSEKIGDYSYTQDTTANWLAMAANYEKMAVTRPAFNYAEPNLLGTEVLE